MRAPGVRVRTLLALVAITGIILGAYRAGYQAGVRDSTPRWRILRYRETDGLGTPMIVRFNMNEPLIAAKFSEMVARLKSTNTSFTVEEKRGVRAD